MCTKREIFTGITSLILGALIASTFLSIEGRPEINASITKDQAETTLFKAMRECSLKHGQPNIDCVETHLVSNNYIITAPYAIVTDQNGGTTRSIGQETLTYYDHHFAGAPCELVLISNGSTGCIISMSFRKLLPPAWWAI